MAYTLLLADDSLTIRRLVELTFAEEKIAVTAVADGRQAIDCLPALRPDIVLADVGMSSPDGYDVAAFVKDTPELAHIPVVLLTAAFQPIDETRADTVRCDAVLAKPFELTLLVSRVKELLRRGKMAPAAAASPADPARDTSDVAPQPAADAVSLDDELDRVDEQSPEAPMALLGAGDDPRGDAWSVASEGDGLSLDDFFEAVEASVRGETGARARDVAPTAGPSRQDPPPVADSAIEAAPGPVNGEPLDEVTRVFLALLQSPAAAVPADAFDRAVRTLLKNQ